MSIFSHQEYRHIVGDILANDEFRQLSGYKHHGCSILEHVEAVSYWSYVLCKLFHLDYVSGARGALLHDFFLYDWREYKRDTANKNHGLEHPKVAFSNASRHFHLNEVEKDIILKHMWPKVFGFPRYPESWIVSMVDKLSAYYEFASDAVLLTKKKLLRR